MTPVPTPVSPRVQTLDQGHDSTRDLPHAASAAVRSRRSGPPQARRQMLAATAAIVAGSALAGCASGPPPDPAARREGIDRAANEALARLYKDRPDARELVARARGVLIFPSVSSAGLIIGGSYGEGVLRIAERPVGYYVTRSGSLGIVAGAERKSLFFLFMEDEALTRFHESSGWTAGADASVTMVDKDYGVGIDTLTRHSPVVGYAISLGGLMANVKLDGTRISRLEP